MGSEDKKKKIVHPAFTVAGQIPQESEFLPDQSGILGETRFVPMDVIETTEQLVVEIDAPGIQMSDVVVKVQGNMLIIEGVKREQAADCEGRINFLCMERSFGPFKRMLTIPEAVDRNSVKGFYKYGVLTIRLPKLSDRRNKTHTVPIEEVKG